jgi:hypothetical protein
MSLTAESSSARRGPDPLIVGCVLLGVLATVAAVCLPGVPAARAIPGIPFLFAGEGYVLAAAVFVPGSMRGSARVMLSLSFSIGMIIIAALALDVVGVRISTRSLIVGTLVLTIVAAIVAVVRARDIAAVPLAWDRRRVGLWVAALGCASIIFAAALAVLARPLPNTHVAGYSSLWARRITGGIQFGVRNEDHSKLTYRVVAATAAGASRAYAFSLSPGSSLTTRVTLPGPPLQIVNVLLYRSSAPAGQAAGPYREVTLRP